MENKIVMKSFLFYIEDNNFNIQHNNENNRFEIEGKIKMIEIVNFGVHSTSNNKKVLCEIDLGNFIPSMNKLYCHISDSNDFLTHTSLKFNNNISSFNGSFKPKIKDIIADTYLTDVWFVLNCNLYY